MALEGCQRKMQAIQNKGPRMDAHAIKPFLHQLVQARKSLLAQIAQQRGGLVSRAEMAADLYEHSDDDTSEINTARELAFAMNEHETAELLAIEAALQRIQNGTYGFCLDCGTHIIHERLQAAPQAMRCVTCQTSHEKQHPH
jgi:DnaK suppressor protein